MFWMRNNENNIPIRTLVWRPAWLFYLYKLLINFLPINLKCVLGAGGDRLIETVLLSTHTICFVLLFLDPDKEILFA